MHGRREVKTGEIMVAGNGNVTARNGGGVG